MQPLLNALDSTRIANRIRAAENIGENALAYSGGAIAIALTEGVLSEEGDAGLIFQPDEIKSTFTSVDDEEAADLAMFLDGLVVNAGFDVVLGLGAKAIRIAKPYFKGGRGLVDKAFVENRTNGFEALKQNVAKADPGGTKLNFFFKCDKKMLERKITLDMVNIPLEDAIRFICMGSGLDYKIERHAVVIFPSTKKKL